MIQNNYGLKRKPITTSNPYSNAIIKRIHQTIRNIIRTFDVSNIVNKNPWSGILAATMFSVRAVYHTTLQASTIQLVLGRDSNLNITHVAGQGKNRQRKQERINCNNKREHKGCNNHQNKLGDKIIFRRKKNSNNELEFMGSFLVTQINYYSTVRFQKLIINDATNIRRIKPFFG